MVNDLSTIAKGPPSAQVGATMPEMPLRTLGLECLVTIMKSLVGWSDELNKKDDKKDAASGASTVGHLVFASTQVY